ncbi:GNAT family N-acetyltransferase [Herbidospora cretacea]|uniref:GNAT family N-acetyltransferase n=1 Tax=Herbidospora cretacea TaxID=28444 RepID=UPI001471023D|nr:GNAT family N-acetyltransferase [Herbidospora cretacea]
MTADVATQTISGSFALPLGPVVSGLYRQVFRLPPFNTSEAGFADQQAYFPKLVDRPGFLLTLARAGAEYVGFGYGYLLASGSQWWNGLEEPLEEAFTAETGDRTFAIIDFGVLPDWRNRSIGRLVHDELLSRSGAERATLAVRPTATETKAFYQRLGWRKVGYEVMDPPIPSPSFDIMVLEQMPMIGR